MKTFRKKWGSLHVIGAFDGKSIFIFVAQTKLLAYITTINDSLVLLAAGGDSYCFDMFDVGQNSNNNNSGVQFKSQMGKQLAEEPMKILPASSLPGCQSNAIFSCPMPNANANPIRGISWLTINRKISLLLQAFLLQPGDPKCL